MSRPVGIARSNRASGTCKYYSIITVTKDEKTAVKDCIERELDKFTKDRKLMPTRVALLTDALEKLK